MDLEEEKHSVLQDTKYLVKINLNFGALQPVVNWCERNCTGKWYYTEDYNGEMYYSWIFVFDEERDYVAFTLFKQ
jgi:hypothetical protein